MSKEVNMCQKCTGYTSKNVACRSCGMDDRVKKIVPADAERIIMKFEKINSYARDLQYEIMELLGEVDNYDEIDDHDN